MSKNNNIYFLLCLSLLRVKYNNKDRKCPSTELFLLREVYFSCDHHFLSYVQGQSGSHHTGSTEKELP